MPKSNAHTHAERDVAEGRPADAIRRLYDRLETKGYEDATLLALGRLHWDLGAAREAGRCWLLSSAEGPQVEEAIARYVSLHSDPSIRKPRRQWIAARAVAASAAGRAARVRDIPPIARERLARLGFPLREEPDPRLVPVRDWSHRLEVWGCLTLLVVGAAGIVAWAILGIRDVIAWLAR
jgi:hypothetical protein